MEQQDPSLPFEFRNKPVSQEAKKANWDTIEAAISREGSLPVRRKFRPATVAVLATVCLVVLGGIWWALSKNDKEAITTIATNYGETKSIVLPDSSMVTLNAKSSIRIPQTWRATAPREVWLEGEAYFKVQKKPATHQKFIVHTKDVNVEVLGTEFNVRDKDSNTQVLLTTGKVKLSVNDNQNEPVIMKPNQLTVYHPHNKKLLISEVNPETYIAWIQHKLIFEKLPVQEICKNIEHFFGTPITIEDAAIARKELTGKLELKNEETVMQTLSLLLGTPIKKTNNRFIIYSK